MHGVKIDIRMMGCNVIDQSGALKMVCFVIHIRKPAVPTSESERGGYNSHT